MWFRERSRLRNVRVQGEEARADVQGAASCPADQGKIMNEGGYPEQIFSVDKTAFHWKKMLSGTFIERRSQWLASKDKWFSC